MFSNIISKTVSDREYNEDTFGFTNRVVFVIDGATGLGENNYMLEGDDAKWFVENVANYLIMHAESMPIVECLSEICSKLLVLYREKNNVNDASIMPSSCISLFKINSDEIEYFGLGDSVGTYELLYDQKLIDLDNTAIAKMVEISKDKNISPIEARAYIQDILLYNRGLMNTDEGYYSLELTGKGLSNSICKSWDISKVKNVCCMSDGFYEIIDFGLYDDMKKVVCALKDDCDTVFKQLYNAQQEDALGFKVPRFKLRDDTTVVYAEVKGD